MQAKPFSHSQLTWMLLSVFLTLQSTLAWTAEEKDETWYQIEVIIAKRGASIETLESFAFRPDSIAWPQGRILRNEVFSRGVQSVAGLRLVITVAAS